MWLTYVGWNGHVVLAHKDKQLCRQKYRNTGGTAEDYKSKENITGAVFIGPYTSISLVANWVERHKAYAPPELTYNLTQEELNQLAVEE